MIGRARPELAKDVCSFPHAGYLVVYRPNSVGIGVARVLHGSRDLGDVEMPRVEANRELLETHRLRLRKSLTLAFCPRAAAQCA
jgi:hypothetical protein